uniref:Uncharacterized protein n=1 Tax=Aegilops tauschii subsp. strangulata TaxID=200361 RepID=A0A453JDN6_AEGTS
HTTTAISISQANEHPSIHPSIQSLTQPSQSQANNNNGPRCSLHRRPPPGRRRRGAIRRRQGQEGQGREEGRSAGALRQRARRRARRRLPGLRALRCGCTGAQQLQHLRLMTHPPALHARTPDRDE